MLCQLWQDANAMPIVAGRQCNASCCRTHCPCAQRERLTFKRLTVHALKTVSSKLEEQLPRHNKIVSERAVADEAC